MKKQKILYCPKSKRKIETRRKIDILNTYTHTHINDRSLFWLGTRTALKSGGLKLP